RSSAWSERPTHNRLVLGSKPSGPTSAEPVTEKAPDLEDELTIAADPIGLAHKVDVHLLEDIHVVITRYAEQWGTVAPRSLLHAVWGHLRALKRLLDGNQAPTLRQHVYVLTAETAALSGWLSHLLDNRGDAHAHWTFARDVARQAGEGPLLAHALVA